MELVVLEYCLVEVLPASEDQRQHVLGLSRAGSCSLPGLPRPKLDMSSLAQLNNPFLGLWDKVNFVGVVITGETEINTF